MSVVDLLTQQVTATRLVAGAGITKSYQALGTFSTLIQPLSENNSIEYGLAYGSGSHAYFDPSAGILVGDKLTDTDGNVYVVSGLRDHRYGSQPFTRALLKLEPGK